LIIKLSQRRRRDERIEGRRRQLTIVVIDSAQVDEHIALRLVIADTLNELLRGVSAQSNGFRSTTPRYFTSTVSELTGVAKRMARAVCTENLIRVDDAMESPKLAE
jgi:hypothetical protein